MDAKRVEKWTWLLIYGGLLLVSLGVFVLRGSVGNIGNIGSLSSASLGWVLLLAGLAGVVAGVVLVVLRSGMPDVLKPPPESSDGRT